MTPLYKVFKEKIIDQLKTVTLANNYDYDLCVLEGALPFYVSKLEKELDGYSFPAVSVMPHIENDDHQRGVLKNKANRAWQIMGAVSTIDDVDTHVERLEQLLFDVKRALIDNGEDPMGAGVSKLIIQDVKFDIPENSVRYAAFRMTVVSGTITETLKKPE